MATKARATIFRDMTEAATRLNEIIGHIYAEWEADDRNALRADVISAGELVDALSADLKALSDI